MKALSIRQPWAWLIVRPDLTDPAERAAAFAAGEIKDVESRFPKIPLPRPGQYDLGGTIGQAELTDSIPPEKARSGQLKSRWYMGEHAFMVGNSTPLPFRKVKGKLNFFEVKPEDIRA